jgi:hypothetical protein
MKKQIFWHELTHKKKTAISRAIKKQDRTSEEFMSMFKQPTWCEYPDALAGMMGCWSLVSKSKSITIDEEYCKTCECSSVFEKEKKMIYKLIRNKDIAKIKENIDDAEQQLKTLKEKYSKGEANRVLELSMLSVEKLISQLNDDLKLIVEAKGQ